MEIFEKRTRIPAPAKKVFEWHQNPEALQCLIPPGEPVRVEECRGIREGARVVLVIGYWPFQLYWVALHRNFLAGRQFTDVQEKGPFRSWEHFHTVLPDGPRACILIDYVEYQLPFGFIGRLALPLVRRKLRTIFAWRHQVTCDATQPECVSAQPDIR
jgi:ligand-binding SRPBCC domain-containing protein